MPKQVVVVASGETERRSLPHLTGYLRADEIVVVEIRIPSRNRALNLEMAERLVKAAWYAPTQGTPPDKFVVLLDADGKDPDQVLRPFREQLPRRLGPGVSAAIQFACAQWHLEAWYFADPSRLSTSIDRNLGNVDISRPDDIENPKLHLKHILGDRVYTAVVSEEIAVSLDAPTIAQHSPSFREFVEAITNGHSTVG